MTNECVWAYISHMMNNDLCSSPDSYGNDERSDKECNENNYYSVKEQPLFLITFYHYQHRHRYFPC